MTLSRVPTMKKGRHYRRCPRHHLDYGGAGDSSPWSGRRESREPRTTRSSSGNAIDPSLGGGIPARRVPFPLQDHEG